MRNTRAVAPLVESVRAQPGSEEWVFAFFDPYALGLGLAERALGVLAAEGFEAVDGRFVQFTPSSIEAIYSPNRPIALDKTWAIPGEVYLLEASYAILLRLPGRPAAEVLRTLKGSADPRKREGHHLRSQLGAPTKALSLMHSSDDVVATVQEAATCFDVRELERTLRAGVPRPQRVTAPLPLLPTALVGRTWQPSPHEFLAALRLRLAEELELVSPAPPELVDGWRRATGALSGLRGAPARSLEVYLELVAAEADWLPALVAEWNSAPMRTALFDYRVEPALAAAALELLHAPTRYRETDLFRVVGATGAWVRNPYERVLLRSALQELA